MYDDLLPMTTWTIGSATITRVEEQLGITNQPCERYFRNFEREVLERHLDWAAPDAGRGTLLSNWSGD